MRSSEQTRGHIQLFLLVAFFFLMYCTTRVLVSSHFLASPEPLITILCCVSCGYGRTLQGVSQALRLRFVRVGYGGAGKQVNGTLAVQNVVAQVGHSSKLVLPIFLRIARLISEVLQYLSTYRPESAKVFTNREAQKASVRDWERTAETPKRPLRECVQ